MVSKRGIISTSRPDTDIDNILIPVSTPWISDNYLRVLSRTSEEINLIWTPSSSSDSTTTADSKSNEDRSSTNIDVPEHPQKDSELNEIVWYEVQMKLPEANSTWEYVYRGFNKQCKVTGLVPDADIHFRMKKSNESKWGSFIKVATEAQCPSADDLHRAIACNAEDMVIRIINGSTTSNLRKILRTHDRTGMTPLMTACQNGSVSLIQLLLQFGAEINLESMTSRKTPLMIACFRGHIPTIQILDKKGADWTAKDKLVCTPIHYAVASGNPSAVEYVINRVGTTTLCDQDKNGWTPIMHAVITSTTEVARLLLSKGANPNVKDILNSKSPLMAATTSTQNKVEMVRLLLEFGADPLYVNSNGTNSLDIAIYNKNSEVSALLQAAIDRINS